MIADINNGGKALVEYIHWRNTSTASIKVKEIMCYEKKRLYKDEFDCELMSWRTYLQDKNGPISSVCIDEDGHDYEPGTKVELEFSSG